MYIVYIIQSCVENLKENKVLCVITAFHYQHCIAVGGPILGLSSFNYLVVTGKIGKILLIGGICVFK